MAAFLQKERKTTSKAKHDNIDLLNMIEKCSQILKDDKLVLRQLIKENNNEVILLLQQFKRKNDLQQLQQELRKYLNKIKGKQQTQFYQQIFQTVSKENQQQTSSNSFVSNVSNNRQPLKEEKNIKKNPSEKMKQLTRNTKIVTNATINNSSSNTTLQINKQIVRTSSKSPFQSNSKLPKQDVSSNNNSEQKMLNQKKQSLQTLKLKQEFSPRFNDDHPIGRKNEKPQVKLEYIYDQKQIEESRKELKQFEDRLNQYSSNELFPNLQFNSSQQSPVHQKIHRKTNTQTFQNRIDSPTNSISQLDHKLAQVDLQEFLTFNNQIGSSSKVQFEFEEPPPTQNILNKRSEVVLASFQNFNAKNYEIDEPYSKVDTEENQCVYQSSNKQQKQYCSLEPEINITQIDFCKQYRTEKNNTEEKNEDSSKKDTPSYNQIQDEKIYIDETQKNLNFNFEDSYQNEHNYQIEPFGIVNQPFNNENQISKNEYQTFKNENDIFKNENQPQNQTFKNEKDIYKNENQIFRIENQPLNNENELIKNENSPFRIENITFKNENQQFKIESQSYKNENQQVRIENQLFKNDCYQNESSKVEYNFGQNYSNNNNYCSKHSFQLQQQEIKSTIEPSQLFSFQPPYQESFQSSSLAPQHMQQFQQIPPKQPPEQPSPTNYEKTYFYEDKRIASSHSKDNSKLESSMKNIEIQEDDIMKKYGDLFTAPDFLLQCKISIQNISTKQQTTPVHAPAPAPVNAPQVNENEFSGKLSWNFMACQSMVYSNANQDKHQNTEWDNDNMLKVQNKRQSQDWDNYKNVLKSNRQSQEWECQQEPIKNLQIWESKQDKECSSKNEMTDNNEWKSKLQGMEKYRAEEIFDEIFSENTLNKISRAFFRFKMESILQNIQEANYKFDNNQLDELFKVIDMKQDNFVDVNEMGQFLEQICIVEENNFRKVFSFIDREGRGYFEPTDLANSLYDIQQQCEVNEIDDLMELEKLYFAECDFLSSGQFTYWEFYLKKNTISGSKINEIMKDFLDQMRMLQP